MYLESFHKHTETTLGFARILSDSHWLFLLARYEHCVEFNNASTRSSSLMERVPSGLLHRGTQLPGRLEGLLMHYIVCIEWLVKGIDKPGVELTTSDEWVHFIDVFTFIFTACPSEMCNNNNNSVQFNSLLFMCRVKSYKAKYRNSAMCNNNNNNNNNNNHWALRG
jgi:hypothetical protein